MSRPLLACFICSNLVKSLLVIIRNELDKRLQMMSIINIHMTQKTHEDALSATELGDT